MAEREWILDELGRIDVEKRSVIVLHYYLDLPMQEVAEILDIPYGTPDGTHVVFGCGDALRDDGMCIADADFTNVVTLVDDPNIHENHFSWGVAAG